MTAIVGLANELRLWPGGTNPANTNFTINASTDAWETIFQAQEDMTITRLGIRQGTVTGSPGVLKFSLQGVADGIPDGTILGGGSPASLTFTPAGGGNNTFAWRNLDNSIAVTRGQWLASVLMRDSGTFDGSNNCSFTSTSAQGVTPGSPYNIQNDAGSRTRQSVSANFGYGTVGAAYGLPLHTAIAVAFNSGSTPDERANIINIPTTWWSTYKIIGAVVYGALAAATTFDLVLYDSNGSDVLQTINIDADNDQSSTAARGRPFLFDESTLSTLNAGSNYYLSLKPGGTSLTLAGMTLASADDMAAYMGGSTVCSAATQTNGLGWTPDTTTRFGINPIIADITAPSGSGGGLPGNLSGGIFQ